MSEETTQIPEGIDTIAAEVESAEQAAETIGRLFDVAQPGSVYAEPTAVGEYTIITASEVTVGMGLGFGSGVDNSDEGSSGGGGGGGGFSTGRPVAAIEVGPNGVRIEPVVDVTKIAIALFTALGAVFVARRRMRKAGRALSE